MSLLLRRALGAVTVTVATVLVAPGTAAIAELPVRPTESHIRSELDDVSVTSPESDRLAVTYEAAREGRVAAQARVQQLLGEEDRATTAVETAEKALTAARRQVDRAESSLRAMAVSAYVGIEGGGASASGIGAGSVHGDDARIVVAEIVGEDRVSTVRRARRGLGEARAVLVDRLDHLDSMRIARVEAEAEQDAQLEIELNTAPDLEDARAVATVDGLDLTLVALDAYTSAAEITAETDPACRLHWSLLAGIGRVETRHGTYGGTELSPAGITGERILGIALTGGGGTAHIPDSDGGELDDDTVYDRAVGPMQFIPSTWARWAQDGDDDGEADPHNLYDTALTAASYLCAAGPGLDADAGRSRALLSYNRSQAYVSKVAGHADDYARFTF